MMAIFMKVPEGYVAFIAIRVQNQSHSFMKILSSLVQSRSLGVRAGESNLWKALP
jgi:hypothetical protein